MSHSHELPRPDDAEWVRRAQGGDAAAFAELVRRYGAAVYAAAYAQLRSHDDAEDAAQEALLAAHASLGSLRQPTSFGPWVCRIAARTAVRRRERQARYAERLRDLAANAHPQPEPDPWQALADGELREAVRGLVRQLSQANREAVELHYLRGYSVAEIAKFLDVPPGTVKRRLFDGRRRLRAMLLDALPPELLENFLPERRPDE